MPRGPSRTGFAFTHADGTRYGVALRPSTPSSARMRFMASILKPSAIRAILQHLGLPSEPVRLPGPEDFQLERALPYRSTESSLTGTVTLDRAIILHGVRIRAFVDVTFAIRARAVLVTQFAIPVTLLAVSVGSVTIILRLAGAARTKLLVDCEATTVTHIRVATALPFVDLPVAIVVLPVTCFRRRAGCCASAPGSVATALRARTARSAAFAGQLLVDS
jgi:hypothetical protein